MKIHNEKPKETCSICGKEYVGYGNNAQPINDGTCCSECNMKVVVPERMKIHFSTQ